ncbi:DUF4124 domain-containing protein [Variovorax sp. PvP013]|uniref:DUF4124 domain-containing protein n=1 Tax=Variovorax sp. PvP013 TaxID=3156435 RepID=UPI003D23321D
MRFDPQGPAVALDLGDHRSTFPSIRDGQASAKLPWMKVSHLLVAACLGMLSLATTAQWQWIDGNGKKVFSDQAPPISVPEKDIVRRPGGTSAPRIPAPSQSQSQPPSQPATTAASAALPRASASAALPRPSGVDRDLEEKTRRAEDADKARQAAEAERVARAKADNCARARQGRSTFDSGIRMARINANGEREIMDDTARAAETQRLQSIIDNECS